MDAISSDDLRRLVREALRDVLPAKKDASSFAAMLRTALTGSKPVWVPVANDLNAFARDIAAACEHPDLRAAILGGQIVFQGSASPQPSIAGGNQSRSNGTHRVDKGLVNEAAVVAAARTSSRIVVSRGVAITPLARDKARELKIELVRDKP